MYGVMCRGSNKSDCLFVISLVESTFSTSLEIYCKKYVLIGKVPDRNGRRSIGYLYR